MIRHDDELGSEAKNVDDCVVHLSRPAIARRAEAVRRLEVEHVDWLEFNDGSKDVQSCLVSGLSVEQVAVNAWAYRHDIGPKTEICKAYWFSSHMFEHAIVESRVVWSVPSKTARPFLVVRIDLPVMRLLKLSAFFSSAFC